MQSIQVNCILWNPQSLVNKIHDFIQILEDNGINIALLCETWFKSQNNHVTALLKEAGFNISHYNRPVEKGGGGLQYFLNKIMRLSLKNRANILHLSVSYKL